MDYMDPDVWYSKNDVKLNYSLTQWLHKELARASAAMVSA